MSWLRRIFIGTILIVPLAAPLATLAQAPAAATAPPLASQQTNWTGVTADVTAFKRKGNTLTVSIRLHNDGSTPVHIPLHYALCYLLDSAAGKKYQVLKDDSGAVIAATNWGADGWEATMPPDQSQNIWMKFPAPPLTTKSVTLNIDNTQPFDDLAIQDVP